MIFLVLFYMSDFLNAFMRVFHFLNEYELPAYLRDKYVNSTSQAK